MVILHSIAALELDTAILVPTTRRVLEVGDFVSLLWMQIRAKFVRAT